MVACLKKVDAVDFVNEHIEMSVSTHYARTRIIVYNNNELIV